MQSKNEEPIIVSIKCLAYNHEKYIRDCLEGFIMQETSFRFEAIVHDDASTDGTAAIIREYAEKYPDIIKPIYETENQYSKHDGSLNRILAEKLTGKYIALCEGDDYWTDPNKLQKQVEYLESHEECVMYAHTANWEVNGVISQNDIRHNKECDLTTEEVIEGGGLYIATASLVFRRELNNIWPSWRKNANVGDYPLQILGTIVGKLHYRPDIMCVYRYQASGSWTEKNLGQKAKNLDYLYGRALWLLELNEDTEYMYEKAVCTSLLKHGCPELFITRRISLRQYIYAMNKGHRSKKINHFIKEMGARYLGATI